MKAMKKTVALLLICSLMVCALAAMTPATAADDRVRTVVGADLTNEQTETVYAAFGVARGSVTELTMTNEEERAYLEGLVEESVIGTNSISCVYLELLEEGAGSSVSVNNVTWCTQEMYQGALATAGVTDVRVIVAAPFPVSGTAALAGIYKAYESLTGEELDETAKQVGTQELVTTAELADELGKYDAAQIVEELKYILDDTRNMTDEELRARIGEIAAQYDVKLNDSQINQLANLCRQLEKLSDSELVQRVEDIQNTVEKLGQVKETASGVAASVQNFFQKVGNFFSRIFGGGDD